MKKHFIFTFLIFANIILHCNIHASNQEYYKYSDYTEILDLSNQEKVLIKKGDNRQYADLNYDDSSWNKISLPSTWDIYYKNYSGICWYRIHVNFANIKLLNSLGISLGKISDVDEVFFNGELIGKTGKFPPNRISAYDKKRLYEIPSTLVKPGEDNIISVRVHALFNHNVSGIYTGSILIGPYSDLLFSYYKAEFFSIFIIFIFIAISAYFVLIFVNTSLDKEYILFSIFSLTTAVYLAFWSQWKYFITDNFFLLKKLEYIIVQLIIPLLFAYVMAFYKEKYKKWHYIYYGLSIFAIIIVMFSNNIQFWYILVFNIVQPMWAIVFGYMIYKSIREFNIESNAKYILALLLIILTVTVNDIMIIRNAYNFYKISSIGYLVTIIGTAYIFRKRMVFLRKQYKKFKNKEDKKISLSDDARKKVLMVIDYINSNYSGEISRENLAASIGIHHDYLGKIFKHYTGKKINDYINMVRVQKAVALLESTEKTVTEIAFESGFESLPTFYRAFQNEKNLTPSDFADKRKKKQKAQ